MPSSEPDQLVVVVVVVVMLLLLLLLLLLFSLLLLMLMALRNLFNMNWSGLSHAYEMAKFAKETGAQLEIQFFEKETRIGGRIKTVGQYIIAWYCFAKGVE